MRNLLIISLNEYLNLNPNDKSFSLDPEIFKLFLVEEILIFSLC